MLTTLKSKAMSWIIQQFPKEEIIITVPEKNLLYQLHGTLEEILGEEVGIVYGNKKQFCRVTVGIINSLSTLAQHDPDRFKNVQVLLCDEAHRVGANFYKHLCLACINSDYRLGFTAKALRKTGDMLVMEGLLGPILLSIKEQELVDKKILANPIYIELPFNSGELTYRGYNHIRRSYNTPNGKPHRAEVVKANIVLNTRRNEIIIGIVMEYLKNNPKLPLLVLIHNIEHGEILQELLHLKGIDIPFVHGKCKIKERRGLISDLIEGNVKAAIASSIFNEGQDIPNLGVGILAGGGASEAKFIQQWGRLLRRHPGKTNGVLIDFHDNEPYYLETNFYQRYQVALNTYPKSIRKLNEKEVLIAASKHFKDF